MLKPSTFILLAFLFYANQMQAQNRRWNVWCFGTAAEISFNSGSPVAVNGCAMNTLEGSASICDSTTGQLLFYTDGSFVWNKNNVVMPGNTIPLGGNTSSTQSAIIVPMPGSSTSYYVFAVDAQGAGGVSVSVIDMSLQGGLGDVAQQPQAVISPTCEKLTACRMANGGGYWVITHLFDSDEFYAIPVTSAGLGTPVISQQGNVIQDISGFGDEAIGYMKTSPDDTKIAMATWQDMNQVQLFNFDNTTGSVSAPVFTDTLPNMKSNDGPYGLSFSPNSKLLYIGIVDADTIYQYNLLAGSAAAIVASKYALFCSNGDAGELQIAPDGKIYVTNEYGSGTLDCISSPNTYGAGCNYVDNAVSLGSGTSSIGLPNCIDDLFSADTGIQPLQANIISTNVLCSNICNGTATVSAQAGSPPYSYNWQPGGLTTASIDSLCAGTYLVTVTDSAGAMVTDSVTVTATSPPSVTTSTPAAIFCSGDSTQICATPGFVSYSWSSTDTTTCITTGFSGQYTVTVEDSSGCTAASTPLSISTYTPSPVTISVNGDTLTSYSAVSYEWEFNGQPIAGDTTRTIIATNTGNYNVEITDTNGCRYNSSTTFVSTGVSNVPATELIKVYPNPLTSGNWQVDVTEDLMGSRYEIFDADGRIVFKATISHLHSEIELDAAKGVYIMQLQSAQSNYNFKLVKM